jgi:Cellulose binding domain
MSTGPRGGRGARRRPARSGRWLAPLGKNTWYLAIVAAAALGLTAGGVALLAGSGGGKPSREAAPDCGLINCSASLPGPSSTISTQSQVGKAHTAVSHPPAAPARPASPGSSAPAQGASTPAVPTPAPPAPANVSVAFSSNRDRRDFDRFQAQMTLVNNGGSPVSGWTVQLTLPGDGVDSVENQSGRDGVQFEHWQFSGDTLTITADAGSETLGPGAPMNLSIHGRGNAPSPTGCTFNGASCPLVQQEQPGQPGQFAGLDQQPGQQSAQPGQEGQWAGQEGQRSWQPGGQWPGTGQPYR